MNEIYAKAKYLIKKEGIQQASLDYGINYEKLRNFILLNDDPFTANQKRVISARYKRIREQKILTQLNTLRDQYDREHLREYKEEFIAAQRDTHLDNKATGGVRRTTSQQRFHSFLGE